MDKREHDLFLIYSREDGVAASELAGALNGGGVDVWFDQWELIPGEDGEEQCRAAMTNSAIIAPCFSAGSGGDPRAELMLKHALSLSKKDPTHLIVPFLLRGAEPEQAAARTRAKASVDVREGVNPEGLICLLNDAVLELGGLPQNICLKQKGEVASALFRPILEVSRRAAALGAERPETLTAMNNVAEALRTVGELERARELQEQVLKTRQRVLGESHPDTLASMNNLAGTLFASGAQADAQALLEHALELSGKVLDAEGPGVLRGLIEKGIRSVTSRDSGTMTVGELAPTLESNLYGMLSEQGKLVRRDRQKALVELAKDILRGRSAPAIDALKLALELKNERAFDYARRILARARRDPASNDDPRLRLKLAQQHALCTYKDTSLPIADRLDRALSILHEVEDLRTTKNQETLGLAGAIHKRKWEADGQKQHLERAFFYYYRGLEQGIAPDFGYNAINTAFVLDLLASMEAAEAEKAGEVSDSAERRRKEARDIREEIVKVVPPLADAPENAWLKTAWWFHSTVGEAYFGLQRYDEALKWLMGSRSELRVPEWEYESTARQLAALARIQSRSATPQGDSAADQSELEKTAAWATLKKFLGDDAAAVRSAFIGKIGLALSGGGFRASLFHVGVLAKLAEFDVLRHVEVLSCVSGGAIIGAHYYLELRRLLQSKPDSEITRDDYVELVRRVEKDFLEGVQRNIRTRVGSEWLTSMKSFFLGTPARTLRAGELYESEIFSRVGDGEGDKPRWLNELQIRPAGEPANFMPQYDNWRRAAKVPAFIINATTLNTGHNWQFSVSWMGEPVESIDPEVDANDRLRRLHYWEAPEGHRRVRLGHAVAASACVPGFYEPLTLDGLYPEMTVRLVDGTFKGGQGTMGLLEQDCSVILASDASGQMSSQRRPLPGFAETFLRSISVLVASLREAKYRDLSARRRSSLLRGLMFVHLKKGLDVHPVGWVGAEPYDFNDDFCYASQSDLTAYGVPKQIQERLANIRSDFDSFSDAEAYALMTSGYRMTEWEFPHSIEGFPQNSPPAVQWRFLEIEKIMRLDARTEAVGARLIRLLDVAGYAGFKAWRLSRPVQLLTLSLLGVLGLAVALLLTRFGPLSKPEVLRALLFTALAVVGFVLAFVIQTVVSSKSPVDFALELWMTTIGFLANRFRRHISDPFYLREGSIERLVRSKR